MLLQISTTHRPATDLGYLLAKNPHRAQSFDLTFGQAHCFYPEAGENRCTAALLLDVDPVQLVRGRRRGEGTLSAYVNDRPYAASAFMSVALAGVFGSALGGRSRERPELASRAIPLEITVENVPCQGGESLLRSLFEPLGYKVQVKRLTLDDRFPEWGESRYYRLTLSIRGKLCDVLTHLYVLLPVLDGDKHYWIGEAEVEKLLNRGAGWLDGHPQRELIVTRYLKRKSLLIQDALTRLAPEGGEAGDAEAPSRLETDGLEQLLSPPRAAPSLHQQRLNRVLELLRASGAQRVLDLGCGEGKLLGDLVADPQFTEIVGLDASHQALEGAESRLRLHRFPEAERSRLRLLHGALTYRDDRLKGFDAAAVVEVLEHLDPGRLRAFESVLWEFARPRMILLTTPNAEYNAKWSALAEGQLRHGDHRFEWTRAQFQAWATAVACRHEYAVEFEDLGPAEADLGAPSQMAVFRLLD